MSVFCRESNIVNLAAYRAARGESPESGRSPDVCTRPSNPREPGVLSARAVVHRTRMLGHLRRTALAVDPQPHAR